ncbi:MAG: hypothetical protein BAA01_04545 [Bacillus thermozeamaize]|uniref:Uncharacterized protein n=1 Tax=Bacillus thermozeamaize TaxID=230954 RepID=A0A1Y3PAI5_9BACI|nr:MAG: hypothetical protein BAA01_04545 [Bacillus thermozeamaize]
MKELMEALKRKDVEKRIPVLRMEMDYQLAVLYEALQEQDEETIRLCKENLSELRKELLMLEA